MIDAIRKMNGTAARTSGSAWEVCDSVESTALNGNATRQVSQFAVAEAGMPLRLSVVTCTARHRTDRVPDQTRMTRLAGTGAGAAIVVGSQETHPDTSIAETATRTDRFTMTPGAGGPRGRFGPMDCWEGRRQVRPALHTPSVQRA